MGKRKLIEQLNEFVIKLNKDFSIKEIILFGSRAKGKQRKDSDIDLMIISDDFKNMNFFERGAKMYDYWNIDLPVDFICYTEKEFNNLKKRITIAKEALEHGISLIK